MQEVIYFLKELTHIVGISSIIILIISGTIFIVKKMFSKERID